MKKIIALFMAITLITVSVSGCGKKESKVLNVFNWGDYINMELLEDFEKETGIKVVYSTFATNEDMWVRFTQGGNEYDVLFPSEYIIEKMIREDRIEKLDLSKLPNLKNIDPAFSNLEFDPNYAHSVPYFWGSVGIVYNKNMITEPITSWKDLWKEEYSQKILMLDSQRDSLMVALKALGYSMNTHDINELNEAKEYLIKQKPLVLAYVGDNVKDMMLQKEAAMAVVYSGEAYAIMQESDEFEYTVPEEGSNYWFDNIVISKTAPNKEAAYQFIDFLLRGEVGKKNTDYIFYGTPNVATYELLDDHSKEILGRFPFEELQKGSEIFRDPQEHIHIYNQIWTEFKAAQ